MTPVLKNILSLTSVRAVSSLLPLFVLPYLIGTIGIESYGVIVLALAFVAYLNTFVDFGFKVSAVRSISKQNKDQAKIKVIASEIIFTKVILLLIALIIGILVITAVPEFNAHLTVFLIILSSLIGYALYPEWFFIGIERMEYVAVISIVFKVLHAASIILFIQHSYDAWIYALIISVEQLLMSITALTIMRWKFNFTIIKVSLQKIKEQLNSNRTLFANQLLPNLYNNTTTILIGFVGGPSLTGVYGVIRKFINLAESLLKIISRVFFPAINRSQSNIHTYRKIQWSITVVVILGISIISVFLPHFFEGIDRSITIPMIIMAIGIVGLTLYDIYGLNYFLVNHQDKLVLKNTLLFSVAGFVLAYPLIYWGGLVGATSIVALTRVSIGGRLMILSASNKP